MQERKKKRFFTDDVILSNNNKLSNDGLHSWYLNDASFLQDVRISCHRRVPSFPSYEIPSNIVSEPLNFVLEISDFVRKLLHPISSASCHRTAWYWTVTSATTYAYCVIQCLLSTCGENLTLSKIVVRHRQYLIPISYGYRAQALPILER